MSSEPFEDWAVLELMGHRRLAGFVRETELAGAGVIRIDVPGAGDTKTTQYYSPSALYALTPCSEEMARAFAQRAQPEPVHRWELPAAPREHEAVDLYPPEADDVPDDEEC